MKIRNTTLIGFLFLCLATPALADDDLSKREWSVNDMQPLSSYRPSNGAVENFVNKLLDADWNMPLCSFKFVDVYDGVFRLVALLDINGRHNCSKLVVIEKSGAHFNIVNNIEVISNGDVNDMLEDVDNDNSPELIVTQAWSRPERGVCLATWQHIYKWHDGKFTDQSASFPKYYKDRRDQLIKSLAHDPDVICHQMEVDKISRMLGAPTAGFVRAEMWIQDPSESLRRKAATVFADIGDAASKKKLASMTKDSDPLTAKSAQMYLDSMP